MYTQITTEETNPTCHLSALQRRNIMNETVPVTTSSCTQQVVGALYLLALVAVLIFLFL